MVSLRDSSQLHSFLNTPFYSDRLLPVPISGRSLNVWPQLGGILNLTLVCLHDCYAATPYVPLAPCSLALSFNPHTCCPFLVLALFAPLPACCRNRTIASSTTAINLTLLPTAQWAAPARILATCASLPHLQALISRSLLCHFWCVNSVSH